MIERFAKELDEIRKEKRFREVKVIDKNLINLSSNDYIFIGSDAKVREDFYKEYGGLNLPFSSSSSRLISGTFKGIEELELELYKIYGKESLVFNSGFDANSCFIETVCSKDTLIITDRLNHASIYKGILDSKIKFVTYEHLNMEHLKKLLIKYSEKYSEILVITETIYSMDGDYCNLKKLIELKKKYKFNLMIDEAHSYGVYGYGMVYAHKLLEEVDHIVIPLGKGGGSIGAYILTDKITRDYLINKGKKFIYTTALPPINIAWNLFILKNMNKFSDNIKKLHRLKYFTLKNLREKGIKTSSKTHIISIVIPEIEKLEKIVEEAKAKGFFIYPVKEPTVPKGTSRIRIGLNSSIEKSEILDFLEIITKN
ncbi:MAG: aminotransferase class I/II-fold pyridoxal phosphate-dependent enzyme [Fusobacteriaceae bacterium]